MTASPSPPPIPPLLRDPWAWTSIGSALLLFLLCRRAPLGEPVADDFDYLYRSTFGPHGAWLDGGGAVMYWRPLSRQLYYGLFSNTLLHAPAIVAFGHALLLAMTAFLFYRAFRPRMSGLAAFSIASFPLLMESSRMLVVWPSNFQDLGALFFVALAFHELSRQRIVTFLAASLAAALCKEVGAVGAVLALACPGLAPQPFRRWKVWSAALFVVLIGWAIAYAWVFAHASLATPPFDAASAPGADGGPLRYVTLLAWTLGAAFSLPRTVAAPWLGAAALIGLGVLAAYCARRRAAAGDPTPWFAWGAAWFLLLTATLVPFYSIWNPYRSSFVVLGLGVAITMVLHAIHPRLLVAMLALRVMLLVAAPAPATEVRISAEESGAYIDVPKLTRLQRLVRDIREQLAEHYPHLPPGAAIAQHNLPPMTGYALGGNKALRVWYGDSTLRWVNISDWTRGDVSDVVTIVEFQNVPEHPIGLVEPGAMRALFAAVDDVGKQHWDSAVAKLDSAAVLQSADQAPMFLSTLHAHRAMALAAMGRTTEAEDAARHARALNLVDLDVHFVLGVLDWQAGRMGEAAAQLDSALALAPGDPVAIVVRAEVRAGRGPSRSISDYLTLRANSRNAP